jgi:hypothetical protein
MKEKINMVCTRNEVLMMVKMLMLLCEVPLILCVIKQTSDKKIHTVKLLKISKGNFQPITVTWAQTLDTTNRSSREMTLDGLWVAHFQIRDKVTKSEENLKVHSSHETIKLHRRNAVMYLWVP